MPLILFTFFAALSIEILGTIVSVIGLSTLFGSNPIIIALAIALDVGKLAVVTLLYSYWKKLNKIMKSYALVAATITMMITSAGAAGYLSAEFQKAIIGTQEGALKVDVLKGQIAKYEERKKQIDAQIAAIPDRYTANQKIRLMNQFKQEQKDLQDKISAIDKELPELQVKQINTEAKAGPILYIAKAFDVPVEVAVKYVILMIIFVFDPLAVFLIIAGNFLLEQRRKEKSTPTPDPEKLTVPEPDPTTQHVGRAALKAEPTPSTVNNKTVMASDMPTLQPVVPEVTPPVQVSATTPVVPEVPAATPSVAEVQAPPTFQPMMEPVAPQPITPAEAMTPEARETITLDDLLRPHSTLHDVRADNSIVFDDNPRASATSAVYRNLNQG